MARKLEEWRLFLNSLPTNTAVARAFLATWLPLQARPSAAGESPAPALQGPADLQRRLAENAELLAVAAPHLGWVSVSLGSRGHVVHLLDRDGIVLYATGNRPDMMTTLGLLPGYDWSERTRGANAAGSALASDRPVALVGPEQCSRPEEDWTCIGAPLHSPDGSVIGAIGVGTCVADGDPSRLVLTAHLAHVIDRELMLRQATIPPGASSGVQAPTTQAEQTLAFLTEAGRLLVASLDYEAAIGAVARLALARMADCCCVFLLEPDGSLRCLEAAHRDPEKGLHLRDHYRRHPLDPRASSGVPQVVRQGQAELIAEMDETELECASSLIVPLIVRGQTLGAVSFRFSRAAGRRYGPADLVWAEDLARQVAFAVDSARLAHRAKEQEERFRLVTESVADHAIFLLDLEGRVLTWNAGAERLLGYSAEEAIGKPLSLFFTPEEVATGQPQLELQQAAEHGRASDDRWLVRKDGSRFWASGSLTALKNGVLRGFVKILRDLTERQQFVEELHRQTQEQAQATHSAEESLALLDSLLANGPVGFAFFDRQKHYVRINEHLARINGLPAEAHLGRTVCEVLPVTGPLVEPVLEQVFQTGEAVVDLEVNGETPAAPGVRRSWLTGFYPVRLGHREQEESTASARTAHDKVRWVGAVVLEITERKRLEAELSLRADELATVDRRKNQFLAQLGHELRNPLAPIRTGLAVLGMRWADDPTVSETKEMMERQVEHLVRLVDDLLDVARISRGLMELRKERVDVAEVLARAAEAARPFLDERQHRLEVSSPRGPLWLNADPFRLTQILVNLLHNAAKYTDPGGLVRLEAELANQEHEPRSATGGPGHPEIVFRVSDNGMGISPELRPHLFEALTQGERPAHLREGLGLGLALVKGLARLHGGTAEASSQGVGKGSEFIVRLPLSSEIEPTPSAVVEEQRATLPLRILLVDDNVDGATTLAALLRMQGHETRAVYDGPSALEAAADFRPDIILLDIGLPRGMDGYEVARRLRDIPGLEDAILVALTGYGQEQDRERSRRAGMAAHLVKPVDLLLLHDLLQQVRDD